MTEIDDAIEKANPAVDGQKPQNAADGQEQEKPADAQNSQDAAGSSARPGETQADGVEETDEQKAARIRNTLLNEFVTVNKKDKPPEEDSADDEEFEIVMPEGDPKDWTDEMMRSILRRHYGEDFDKLELTVKEDEAKLNARQKMKLRRQRIKDHNNSPIDPDREIETVQVEVDPLLDEADFLSKIEQYINEYKGFWTDVIARREGIISALGGLIAEISEDTEMGSLDIPDRLVKLAIDAAMIKEICSKLEIDESLMLALDPKRSGGQNDIAAILREELHKVLKSYSVQGS